MLCTFVNNGGIFVFDSKKETQHQWHARRVSMFEVHGELALEAMGDGHGNTTYLLDSKGNHMDAKSIKQHIKFLRGQK